MAGYPATARRQRFVEVWNESGGSPTRVAETLGIGIRNVYRMREQLANSGTVLQTTNGQSEYGWQAAPPKWPRRREVTVKDRCIVIGSDAHFWPGIITTAWRAFCAVAKALEPAYVILNGDTLDGATISRHDPIAWENPPTLAAELEAVSDRLAEIQKAAPNSKKLWTCGNHDTRYERKLASLVPQYRDVKGSCLQDHIPGWPMSWSVMFNEETSPLLVTHAAYGGSHAAYRNTLHSGVSICTGHLHAQLVRPYTDFRGTRYGIDAGTLADIYGPQFGYKMDRPTDWRSGFAVLTFDKKGRLQPPELCEVQTHAKDQAAFFRGKIVAEGKLEH